jgi:hypothetical protein
MKQPVFFSLILLVLGFGDVEAKDDIAMLQKEAHELQLGKHPEWLNLLHYKSARFSSNTYISYVDDVRFFFSKNGKTDPQAELEETLTAFYQSDPKGDSHALCRFPARFRWLKNHLNFHSEDLPDVVCKEYSDWKGMIKATQAALIFPAYYLNSPSSMFGHTLLRLDNSEEDGGSKWLSFAVNFGANIRRKDNNIVFAYKGLSGGYPGLFNVMPYFKKIQEYNTIENRDIWEYRLNLSVQEVDRMVTHLWELKGIEFDYYFFYENCSFRLLELLEVARPGIELTDKFSLTAIPVDTVRAIVAEELTEDATYRPSQAVLLKNQLSKIPEKNKDLVKAVSKNPDKVQSNEFNLLPDDQKREVLSASYKYLRFRQTKKARNNKVAHDSYRLLAFINRLPKGTPEELTPPIRPDRGHLTKRITVGAGERNKAGYGELGLRLAFHSLEEREEGFLRGAQINAFNLLVGVDEKEHINIKQADFIDIFSLTPRDTFFKPISWKVYTGLEQQYVDMRDHTAAHVTSGMGLSYSATQSGLVYMLATGRLEYNRGFKRNISIALGADLGALYYFKKGVSKIGLSAFSFENNEDRVKLKASHNITLARNHALQFSFQREQVEETVLNEFSIRYHYYYE